MNKKAIIKIIIATIIIVVTMISTYFCYKGSTKLTIYATEDSYAYKYANNNFIKVKKIAKSLLEKLPIHLEDFQYNVDDNKATIIKYEGLSEKLYIPKTIDGYEVEKIAGESLSEFVRVLVIPETIKEIDENILSTMKIMCYKNDYCTSLKENKDLDVEYLNDRSEYYIDNSTKDYSYNMKYDKIIITNYRKETKDLIIPETINGYKVNRIDIDGRKYDNIYIPETIIQISDNLISIYPGNIFKKSFIIELISLIIIVILTFIYQKNNIGISLFYLITVIYVIYSIYKNQSDYNSYISKFIIFTSLYIVLEIILKKRNKEKNK